MGGFYLSPGFGISYFVHLNDGIGRELYLCIGGIRNLIDEQIVCSGVKVEGSGVTFVGKEQFLTIG